MHTMRLLSRSGGGARHAAVRGMALAALAALGGALGSAPAAAQWAGAVRPDAVFVQAGATARDGVVAGVGLRWDWDWRARRWGGLFSAATEVSLGHWRSDAASGSHAFTQLSVVPLLRWRPGEGRSPWFVEGGIGLSLHDSHYLAGDARMSTRWNFHDVLAAGRSFGAGGRQELSLRLIHISNASFKRPNPGENLLALRYALAF